MGMLRGEMLGISKAGREEEREEGEQRGKRNREDIGWKFHEKKI